MKKRKKYSGKQETDKNNIACKIKHKCTKS